MSQEVQGHMTKWTNLPLKLGPSGERGQRLLGKICFESVRRKGHAPDSSDKDVVEIRAFERSRHDPDSALKITSLCDSNFVYSVHKVKCAEVFLHLQTESVVTLRIIRRLTKHAASFYLELLHLFSLSPVSSLPSDIPVVPVTGCDRLMSSISANVLSNEDGVSFRERRFVGDRR